MTEREFIDNILGKYNIAGDLLEGDEGYNIKRGMAHPISGYVEDLFALYMAKKINQSHYQYLVDKVISIRLSKEKKAKSFKPDLMIAESNLMIHYFDLKTNLGWNRHLENYLKEKNDFIGKIKGKEAWIRFGKKDVQAINISDDLKYQMVVVFGWNINQDLLKNNLRLAQSLEHVSVHVLYTKNDQTNKYEINRTAFDQLIKFTKNTVVL